MNLIAPFRALRVIPELADRVAAPPYDVLDSDEARALAAGNPDSFLHVSKPEIDFPPGTDEHSDAVYSKGRRNLDRLVHDGLLQREATPSLYLYRLVMGSHEQIGLVAAASVQAYQDGRIKRHEHTKPDKVQDRARNADALDAHTGTLFLAYPAQPAVDARVREITTRPPEVDITASDGIRHSVWVVSDPGQVASLADPVNALEAVYIADGHHRSAAAARLRQWRREAIQAGQEVAPAERFLAVLFPDDQVQILPYNRVVTTLGGRTPDEFVQALGDAFEIELASTPVQPAGRGEMGLYVGGAWHRLRIRPELILDDVLARLDINLLQEHCLGPLLGIHDQRNDERIDFVGGIRGLGELERRVNEGNAQAAFSLCATSLRDLLAIADRGQVMPPKSTWFEPKLRDGLLVLPLR